MDGVTMIRIIIICFVIFSNEIYGLRRRCVNTGVLFPDKILNSPIVVYGEALGKSIYVETETELLFNITFRVDCILKGQDIDQRIEITDAGIKNGRTACQWLDPGKLYIVFLDKCALNESSYCPLDFQERLIDDITYELLEKTCHLTRMPSLNSISNNCPNVSMTEYCPNDEMDVKIMPKGKNLDDDNIHMKTSFNHPHQFDLQTNITTPKDGLLIDRIADHPHNHADFSTLVSVGMIILAVSTAIFV